MHSHGDYDLTPTFCADGRYTTLINFGEIQGTEPLFDMGHRPRRGMSGCRRDSGPWNFDASERREFHHAGMTQTPRSAPGLLRTVDAVDWAAPHP